MSFSTVSGRKRRRKWDAMGGKQRGGRGEDSWGVLELRRPKDVGTFSRNWKFEGAFFSLCSSYSVWRRLPRHALHYLIPRPQMDERNGNGCWVAQFRTGREKIERKKCIFHHSMADGLEKCMAQPLYAHHTVPGWQVPLFCSSYTLLPNETKKLKLESIVFPASEIE